MAHVTALAYYASAARSILSSALVARELHGLACELVRE